MNYPVIDDPHPAGLNVRSQQFSNATPEAGAARAALVAVGVDRLVVDNLQTRWPDGAPPAEWDAHVKIANGSNEQFAQDSDQAPPPMHAIWGRDLTGGYIHAPLACASRDGVDRIAIEDSTIRLLDR